MCGISGISLQHGITDPSRVQRSLKSLQHRGPDDCNTFVNDKVGLAHARLSIIDLAGGQQPLYSQDKNLVLVANGEIYNYIELREKLSQSGYHCHTHSDCEVILQAYRCYGDDFVRHLDGMFAFALWDSRRERSGLTQK